MTVPELQREMLAEAQQRWPSIAVTPTEYEDYCQRMAGGRSLEVLRPYASDLYLCCACAKQDATAAELLKQEAEAVVRGAIARVHRDGEFVRETMQEFWKKLLAGSEARVRDYGGRGPLQAWLRISASRLAMDLRRARRTVEGREAELVDCMVDQPFGPESTLTRQRYHEPFKAALRSAIADLSQKERNLLRMHIQGRCSIDQIGRAYGVHRATAARWLEQTRGRILDDVRARLEMSGSRLTDSEFWSVARIVGGDLELGLSTNTET